MIGSSLGRTPALSLRRTDLERRGARPVSGAPRVHVARALPSRRLLLLVTMLSIVLVAPAEAHLMWTMPGSQVEGGDDAAVPRRLAPHPWRAAELLDVDVIDVASGFGLCLGWAMMTAFQPAQVRPDQIGLLACTFTLILRSALIPSTPIRSALLSGVLLVPLVAITHVRLAGTKTTAPISAAVYAAIWSLLAIGATTTTTWVIYGLRLQVRKAMQLGQYLLEEKIGQGGMGTVYRASHAMLRRPTAIKLLARETTSRSLASSAKCSLLSQ